MIEIGSRDFQSAMKISLEPTLRVCLSGLASVLIFNLVKGDYLVFVGSIGVEWYRESKVPCVR